MKKLLALLIVLGGSYLLTANVFAKDCLNLSFTDGDICINIDKDDDEYTLDADLSDTNGTVSLKCDILLPDNSLKNVGACNGSFTYSKEDTRKIKLYVRLNNEYKTKESYYDFDEGERGSSVGSSNSNEDLDNFDLTADDTTPSTSQRVDLTIEARDDSDDTVTDYDGTVDFKIYYRSSSSSSWTQTTSSTYYEIDEDYEDGYEFDSSDDGEADLTNFIKFKKNNYDYKVRVYDEDDSSIYEEITFDVGSSSSSNNGDLDNFDLTADDTTPSTSQRVDLTIEARDDSDDTVTDYDGTVDFKVYYRSSSSSSWTQTTSSTYYEIDTDYEDGYEFDSSDDGEADLTNFIKFKKNNYDYKVRVYDEDDTSIYEEITFDVGSSSSSNNGDLDNFDLTADDTTPSTSQRVDLTIEARDDSDDTVTDYDGTVDFKIYYRSSSSSSWTQTTSSTYYEIDEDYEDGYEFDSSDDGEADLTNFIQFKKNNYDYKVRVYDEDDTSIYEEITFDVGSSSSSNNGDLDNFDLTADDTTPSTSQRVDLTIEARDDSDDTVTDYDGTVDFKVYYRSSSSSSWTQTTSSTYYEIDTDYEDGYEFDSSDDGEADLTNFIQFKKNNYDYKVRVYDEDDSSIYEEITFDVGSSSSSNNGDLDNFDLTADDTTPSTSQRVDLTIEARDDSDDTVTDYDGTVDFKIYYRSSSSSSWAQTTSSTYYEIDEDYEDGYEFDSSDDGEADLTNFIKFKKNNYDYKVRVYDEDDSSIYEEITFDVGSSSSSNNGFSSSDIDKVEEVYDGREDTIDNLESDYPKLRINNARQSMSDDLYEEMENIVNGDDSIYDDYDEFYDAFLDRYSYTIRVR